jgi:hypothetical protein
MATPEQNALLAIQLFGAPAEQFNQQNNARTNLLLNLTNRNREEQLKRDLANQSYDKSMELARYSADREDTRQLGYERRQKTQLEAMQTREDTRATESDRKQKEALSARDKSDILNEIDRLYPQYAAAAARAKLPIKDRTEFAETRAGLGQLAAELKTAEVGFEQMRFELAADASIAELEEAKGALNATKSRLLELSKPSPDDEKFARTRAVTALKQAIESGQIESTKKLRPDAIRKGLAELGKGNDETATKFLGEEAIGAYQGAFEQTLMSLPNMKARLQERAQTQQQLLQLQTVTSRIESDLRKGAAANPFLGEKLKASRTGLQDLMTPVEPAKRARSFDEIFQKPGAGAATPARTGVEQLQVPGMIDNPTNEPIIAQENARRQQTVLSAEQQQRGDAYGDAMDQRNNLQALIAGVRSGDPAAVARGTGNLMGGYIPGQVDPSLQASTLAELLRRKAAQDQELEAARRRMLWLQSPVTPGGN